MPTILAHRGNIDGPRADTENSLSSITIALQRGWGLEIDIRRASDGTFYVSHDARPSTRGCEAAPVFAAIARHPHATVAVNIKELGDEADLVTMLERFNIVSQCVVFDMELLEMRPGASARAFRRRHPTLRIAARVSDRAESIDRALRIDVASVIWLDEFDGPWCTAATIERLQAAGRKIFAVSPELHRRSLASARTRWDDFITWGVDGICTDHARELARRLGSAELAVSA
jgi:glycerophosphoryl diester phosphodiesterase